MSLRSTPEPVAFEVELVLEVWECTYGTCSNEKLRIAIAMSVTNKGNLISCFTLQNCIKHYTLLNYLCLSLACRGVCLHRKDKRLLNEISDLQYN